MVSRDDLQEASELQRESRHIQFALESLKLPGTITAVTWTPAGPEVPDTGNRTADPVTIATVGLTYPPQMIQAIQSQLESRYDAILKRLGELGVSVEQAA